MYEQEEAKDAALAAGHDEGNNDWAEAGTSTGSGRKRRGGFKGIHYKRYKRTAGNPTTYPR